jgi:adenosylhomocysteine nucleosidase
LELAGLAVITATEPEASVVRGRLRHCREVVLETGRLWRGQAGVHRVALYRCGMGEERAAAALQWLIEHERLWGVLSIGFAGGLQPHLAAGDVVLADRIQTWPQQTMPEQAVPEAADVIPHARLASLVVTAAQQAGLPWHQGLLLSHKTLVPGALDKRLLGRYSGALAVDMESYHIGRLAAAYRLPFISMRAILDPCDMALNLPVNGLTTPDGGLLPGRAVMAAVRQPGLLKSLLAVWRLSRLTQRRLAVWLKHLFAILGTICSEEDVCSS